MIIEGKDYTLQTHQSIYLFAAPLHAKTYDPLQAAI